MSKEDYSKFEDLMADLAAYLVKLLAEKLLASTSNDIGVLKQAEA